MKRIFSILTLLFSLLIIISACSKEEDNEKFDLEALWNMQDTEQKSVIFPHGKHKEKVDNCNTCHDGDKSKGSIIRKNGGVAPTKENNWAHDLCLQCHGEGKRKPLKCDNCHTGN